MKREEKNKVADKAESQNTDKTAFFKTPQPPPKYIFL